MEKSQKFLIVDKKEEVEKHTVIPEKFIIQSER